MGFWGTPAKEEVNQVENEAEQKNDQFAAMVKSITAPYRPVVKKAKRKPRSDSVAEILKRLARVERELAKLKKQSNEKEVVEFKVPYRIDTDLKPLADFLKNVMPRFTTSGKKGLYARRDELPYPFNEMCRDFMTTAAKQMVQDKLIRRSSNGFLY